MIRQDIFRAYDIRGIVGETLHEEDAYNIGRAFAKSCSLEGIKNICIGYDGRHSSPELSKQVINGIIDSGLDVVNIGLCPTPQLYFSTKFLNLGAGIMITGSHNPPSHNGFKMMKKLALYGDEILDLYSIIKKEDFISGKGNYELKDTKPDYVSKLVNACTPRKKLKIAWDAGNGSAGEIMELISQEIDAEHILLNEKIDGNFPSHHPDPSVAENLQQLIKAVKDNNCDLGLAFDGDGDRVGAIDNKGNIINGDELISLFTKDILKNNEGEIVIADVKASKLVFDNIISNKGKAIMWKTGHSLIKSKMHEVKAIFAGEVSGHIFFRENYGFDDGLYAAVKLINLTENLQNQIAEFPKLFTTAELRIDVEEARKFSIIDEIKSRIDQSKFIDIDGIRYNDKNGWWLLRASNTQAALVARCEASSQAELEKLQLMLKGQLSESGVSINF